MSDSVREKKIKQKLKNRNFTRWRKYYFLTSPTSRAEYFPSWIVYSNTKLTGFLNKSNAEWFGMKLYGEEFPETKFRLCSKLFTDHKSQIVALIVELTEWTNGFCVDITKSIMKSIESYESKVGASSGSSNARLITHIHRDTLTWHIHTHITHTFTFGLLCTTWDSFRPDTAQKLLQKMPRQVSATMQQCCLR